MKPMLLVLIAVVALCGCSKDSPQSGSQPIEPLPSARHNRLAILSATPKQGPGKILALDLKTGTVSESSHRISPDSVMRLLPESREIIVFNREERGGTQVFDLALQQKNNYRVLPDVDFPNFQDAIEVAPNEVYVSSHELASLYRIDSRTGKLLKEIPLGTFADGDGIPEATHLAKVGDRTAVLLQRLSRPSFAPSEYSSVAVIDPKSDVVAADPIRLNCVNPSHIEAISAKEAFVSCQGSYENATSAAIEVIDLETGRSKETAWKESELGGKPQFFVALSRFFLASVLYVSPGQSALTFNGFKSVERTPAVPFQEGYWSLALDVDRRLLWVGKAGVAFHEVQALSLDDHSVVRSLKLEAIPQQLEWLD